MKVERVLSTIVALPLKRPHKLAMSTITRHTMVIVQLWTDDGALGVGEVSIIPHYGPESPGAVKHVIDHYLSPRLIGLDPRNTMALLGAMDDAIVGNAYAKSGVEMACLDCAARAARSSVATLLGGSVRRRIPALWVLGHGEVEPDVAEARELVDSQSHRLFLVKVGKGDAQENVDRALAIKRALGDGVGVRVDANQGWDEATAAWCIERMEDGGIEAIEQPVAAWNREAMRRLARRFTVPLIADEAVCTLQDAMALARDGAADGFSVKVSKHGGLWRATQIATLAQSAGISLFGGTMLEGAIGTSACAQLFSTFASLRWGCQLFGPKLLLDDIAAAPVEFDHFDLLVPDCVGLGAEIDSDKLRFYTVPLA